MKRNVGQKTVHVFRTLLKKKFDEKLKEIGSDFRHDFSYEKPYFELTIRLDAYDFATTIMEQELLSLGRKLAAANKRIAVLEGGHDVNAEVENLQAEIQEQIYTELHEVVSHQKKGMYHRLVICCTPPQRISKWVPRKENISFGPYHATWDKVEEIPF